jgi:hypothetical protein
MRIEDFPLAWRWTQPSAAVLPSDVLAALTPLEVPDADRLYRRGQELFSARTDKPFVEHQSEEFQATREWLDDLPIPVNAPVFLVWGRDTGIPLPWKTFVAYWDDFCYPSSDDAFIFPASGNACLAWSHYELFQYLENTV